MAARISLFMAELTGLSGFIWSAMLI